MGKDKLTRYEKAVARKCGISAADCVCTGANECGAVYTLYNPWFYICRTFNGYSRDYIYRALLREFIARAEKACGY